MAKPNSSTVSRSCLASCFCKRKRRLCDGPEVHIDSLNHETIPKGGRKSSEANTDLGFMARLMVLCSLPRTTPGNRLRHVRRNGPYALVMSAGAVTKLPFGNLPRLLLAWLTPIWHDKPETARRVRQRIGAVMKWAVAMGYRSDNPAGDALGQALGRQQAVVQHMRALPHGAVADALAIVRVSQASVTTKRAFEFLVLTAARSGEVRLATWDEMDLDAGVWTIPAARMKAKRDHRVPLSRRALAILHDVQRLSDGTGLVFPNPRGKPLSDATLSQLIKELGIAAVPHGFRSSFRDWAAEQTSTPREVVEAALAHTVQNPTEAAYARSDLFERRRRLMDDWAAYLTVPPQA